MPSFLRRASTVLGLVFLVAVLTLLVVRLSTGLLLVFGSLLVALLLSGLAGRVQQMTPLSYGPAVGVVTTLLLVLAVGLGWLVGPPVAEQLGTLQQRAPVMLERIEAAAQARGWSRALLERFPTEALAQSGQGVLQRATQAASTTVDAVSRMGLMLLIGLYLALQPSLYRGGLLRLMPSSARTRGREVLDALGRGLRWWLVGRFASMTVVGLMTVLGLWLTSTPQAVTFGVIAAAFSFIPFIGPILATVPVLLLALANAGISVVTVLIVFAAVQVLESNVITPLIQQRAVSLPPALLVSAQVLMVSLFGVAGLLLATPLMVALVILVQMLYVQDVLGDDIDVLGDAHKPAPEAPLAERTATDEEPEAENPETANQHATAPA